MIVFSIPIHEDNGIVECIIKNIQKFCPSSVIIFHCPISIKLDDEIKSDSVFFNHTKLITGYMDGSLLYAHYLNFKFLDSLDISYDAFLPYASNEVLVRSGLERYLESYDYNIIPIGCARDRQRTIFINDFVYLEILNDLSSIEIRKTVPEGTCYSYKVIDAVFGYLESKEWFLEDIRDIYQKEEGIVKRDKLKRIRKLISFRNIDLFFLWFFPKKFIRYVYPSEETVIPTLAATICMENNYKLGDESYCYIPWSRSDLKVDPRDIDNIRRSDETIFAVKRVERDINDPVRIMTNNLEASN